MSRDAVVAKRYAKALFEIALQHNLVAEVEEQLKLVVDTLKQDQEIERFLTFPNIDVSKKIELIKGAFADRVSSIVSNTIALLISRGRSDIIHDVYEAFRKVAGEATGRSHATVFTAQPLTAEELAKIEARFGSASGKQIAAEQVVDPSLLGGIQVRIGDRLYDGSLAGKLERLRKTMNS
ncbi:F0F1 ATP synthase subunit delta [Paenibacillus beijingensis]|uniref:ATP synthase subunit delta n=1 Tax=Paenibacillus beijingensis TaxID=1126833 RepID=A0A0D5NI12_9BACL|nr:F0F1 ATP synthase subunit delta [Paenibacillus beijingensis]AJY74563.1 ATP synthase F0F1 subunit delta [Paenibacillus beijingensis]